jgi:hypothetical protein
MSKTHLYTSIYTYTQPGRSKKEAMEASLVIVNGENQG